MDSSFNCDANGLYGLFHRVSVREDDMLTDLQGGLMVPLWGAQSLRSVDCRLAYWKEFGRSIVEALGKVFV